MTKRDTYVAKMKLQLDEMNLKMTELEAQAAQLTQEVQAEYQLEMGKLHEHSNLAVRKLEELRSSSEDSWHKLVSDMEKTRNAFTQSFHYFKSQV
jgi:uncharacterized coiled-coil protein SlyX